MHVSKILQKIKKKKCEDSHRGKLYLEENVNYILFIYIHVYVYLKYQSIFVCFNAQPWNIPLKRSLHTDHKYISFPQPTPITITSSQEKLVKIGNFAENTEAQQLLRFCFLFSFSITQNNFRARNHLLSDIQPLATYHHSTNSMTKEEPCLSCNHTKIESQS